MKHTATWLSNEDIACYLAAIKKKYPSDPSRKVGVLGNTFPETIKHSYNLALKKAKGLFGLVLQDFWTRIVDGRGEQDNECLPWWELEYVSFIADFNLVLFVPMC